MAKDRELRQEIKILKDDWVYLCADVGFFSRYGLMPDDYEPLVKRVAKLESTLNLLLEYLNIERIPAKEQLVKKQVKTN